MEDSDDGSDYEISVKPSKRSLEDKSEVQSEQKKLKQYEKKLLKKKRKEEKAIRRLNKQKAKEVSNNTNKNDSELPQDSTATEDSIPKPKGRLYTVSIAVAGSIMDNAQSPPLKAYLAGQVARAASIFNVDEIIVFDDNGGHSKEACEQMARILQFLECPQYLRKTLFPLHTDLKYAGVISPLDAPHHLRRDEALPFREGVVMPRPVKIGEEVSFVNVGLDRDCKVDKKLPEGLRVTVKLKSPDPKYILSKKGTLKGTVVSPRLPRLEENIYWGYNVRIAGNLNKVFEECPYKEPYDVTVGTSEKGEPASNIKFPTTMQHLLIVFGGVEGLEYALENDESLLETEVPSLFKYYVNTCSSQGCRTIRTEEAILISLTVLNSILPT